MTAKETKWVIQHISDETSYWNNNEGWRTAMWIAHYQIHEDKLEDYAEVYTDSEKAMYLLPIDGKWVEKGELNDI